MEEIIKILWIGLASLIGVLHIISPIFKEGVEKIIGYLTLFLHIPLFIALLVAKEKIEVVAITVILSLFVYIVANTLIPFIKRKLNKGSVGRIDDASLVNENIAEGVSKDDI